MISNELSFVDLRIIQSLIKKKSFLEIAEIIERPVEEIFTYVEQYIKGKNIKTYQQVLDDKASAKAKKFLSKLSSASKAKANKIRVQEMSRLHKLHENEVAQKRKKPEKTFATRAENYALKILLRINNKTSIYINPGDDPEAARKKYLRLISPIKA